MHIIIHFRRKKGLIVNLATTFTKSMQPNIGHYTKEVFLATHSSQILPRDSPLLVS